MKFILPAIFLLALTTSAQAQSVAAAQSALSFLGYDPGPVDGAWGGKTRSALEQFYEDRSRSFDGRLDDDDYAVLARELGKLTEADLDRADFPKLVFQDHFTWGTPVVVPAEYAFTNGEPQPKVEGHGTTPFPFVADVNGDRCDDLIMQFMDSYAHPRILYGRDGLGADEKTITIEPATDFPKSRAIRNISRRDADGDGVPDFVAFTAPHRLVGIGFDAMEEPEIIVTGGRARATDGATFAHGGLVGDVNGDGISDVFPISERGGTARYALLGDGNGNFGKRYRVRALSEDTIFSARSVDFNGDGIDDFAFLTAGNYTRDKRIDPEKASRNGTFAVALGEAGKSINDLEFVRYGAHWMDPIRWTLFQLQALSDAGYDTGEDWYYSAPSNLDLIDYDDDGDLDILVGYFVSSKSTWLTSGFQIHRNDNGTFTDVTDEVVPYQPQNRDALYPTDAMIAAQMVDINGDGARDLLLTMQTDDQRPSTGFRASMYFNVEGKFLPVRSHNDPLSDLRYLYAGDFNCDGRVDLAGIGAKTKTEQRLRILFGVPPAENVAAAE